MKLKTISLRIDTLQYLSENTEVLPPSTPIIAAIRSSIEVTRSCSPLSVCFDGDDYWLFDGYHRHAAMMQAGFNTCEVKIYRGSRKDAVRRYIRDKLRSKRCKPIFMHCLRVLNEHPDWRGMEHSALAKLFGRKPSFFEKLALLNSLDGRNRRVVFFFNKHGSIDLFRMRPD